MSFYKNLSGSYPAEVKEGATVKAGQAVGYVGDSAMIEIAEEPHLHFEMTLNDVQVDPADYLEGAQMPQPEEPETDEPIPDDPAIRFDKQPLSALVSNGSVYKHHDPSLQVFNQTTNDYRVHLGIDVATDMNAEVYALYDGTVESMWEDAMMGHCLAINHGNGLYSIYKNLSGSYPAGVEIGATITAGQAVGYVGDSAMMEIADEPHLHFEMTLNGEQVNPLDYLNE
jgi:murein DD-endopeptidase MepM/ murein hydrolase activator NlpD